MTKAIQWMQTASAEEIAQNLLPLFDGAEEELQYDASYDKEHHVYTTDGYHTESGYEAAITLTKLAGVCNLAIGIISLFLLFPALFA